MIEKQVAKAGFRMAAWLDEIVEAYQAKAAEQISEDL